MFIYIFLILVNILNFLVVIYIANGFYSLNLAGKKCDENIRNNNFGHVEEVYHFYCSEWFGFKHWFVEYKEKEIE
jgi:hypothetical protein